MTQIIVAAVLLTINAMAMAAQSTIEIYCLDKVTHYSYGVSGDRFQIEEGALINYIDNQGLPKQIDLKKGECEIIRTYIPDPYEG